MNTMDELDKFVENIKNGIVPDEFPFYHSYSSIDLLEEYHNGALKLSSIWQARKFCTSRGMWAIVDKKWTKDLANWIGNRRCLEVMAGGGWLANALNYHGIDIIATDNYSWKGSHNNMKVVYNVENISGIEAVLKYNDRDILIISWPPYESEEICSICKEWKNKPIVYIGEGDGGCNAPDLFWQNWDEIKNFPDIKLPQWDGLHDVLSIGKYNKNKAIEKTEEYLFEEGK